MPDSPSPPPPGKEIATLGGGCFWCIEAALNQLKGVDSAESGYMGGKQPNPTEEPSPAPPAPASTTRIGVLSPT